MPAAIKVENLSKIYQLGQVGTGTISRDIERWFAKIRGKQDPFLRIGESNKRNVMGISDIVWSLRNLNFEIEEGQAVGIIGTNGAGKSTLLKILSKVTGPTTGRITGKGRIASLLEVGTGFHPELSGKENIYLNGAILGMRKKEIKRKFDEIVDFAGVGRYINTPVKRYSSGMYVRLAFAVAAHLESEILIVDEVLAVGDAEFQKKCLGKMGEVSRGEGRTVLFVSHNMSAVQKLCKNGILLKDGEVGYDGKMGDVIDNYLAFGEVSQSTYAIPAPSDLLDSAGFAYRLQVEDIDGQLLNEIPVGRAWQIRVNFKLNRKINHFIIALGLSNSHDLNLRTTWSRETDLNEGEYEAVFKEEQLLLAAGVYNITLGLSSYERSIHYVENVAAITITEVGMTGLDPTIIRTSGAGLILNPMNIIISSTN